MLFDLQIFSGGVAQPHAQSLFLFPIVFDINLIVSLWTALFDKRSLPCRSVAEGSMSVSPAGTF